MQVRSRLLLTTLILIILITTACQGPPPTEYVIITSTPDGTFTPTPTITPIIIIVTATPEPITPTAQSQAATPTQTTEITPEVTVDAESLMPTITLAQIQVAEQTFQNGRMFWLQPTDQIWVMVNSEDNRQGIWMVFQDDFEEGEVEFDPDIVAPENLLQPERGFGKLWRENPEVREALGWGVQPELGFISNYRYEPGGEIVDGQYVPGFGYHILNSSEGDVYRFNEINGTWQFLRGSRPSSS